MSEFIIIGKVFSIGMVFNMSGFWICHFFEYDKLMNTYWLKDSHTQNPVKNLSYNS